MRFVRFTAASGAGQGIAESDGIAEIVGDRFSDWRRTGRIHRWSDVTLDVPVMPRTFYAAGLNYAQHIKEGAEILGIEPFIPASAELSLRAPSALVAHDQPVVIPPDAGAAIQYESELVVVIGKAARNVEEAQALQHVFGYTIGNDVSERDWQRVDRTQFRSKNSDTFKPMGPWIETDFDLDAATTTVRVNGAQTFQFATSNMIFSIAQFISRTSRYCTFHPGDVIWMGTDGVSPNLAHGDVVEIEISGIGTLRNRFVRQGQ